jgi:AbrB family looped-hinge helix DNA binding protein
MGLHYPTKMAAIVEAEAKLTAQNQITIPAPVRKYLQLRGGVSRVKFQLSKDGVVVVRTAGRKSAGHEDPGLRPFLDLLAGDMAKKPGRIIPFPARLLSRARAAVKGIKVDLDAPLTGRD